MSRAAFGAILAAVLACSLAVPARASRHGRVLRLTMPAPSVGEFHRTIRLYLPPSYDDSAAAERRYPVVYMLHGWPGSDGNLLGMGHVAEIADSLIARGAMPEVVLVFPSGAGSGLLGRSFYLNGEPGSKPVEDYLVHDVVPWVDRNYRTVPAPWGRGVIGISEGGDGAANLAFRHPELFSAFGAHSASFVLRRGLGTAAFLGSDPGATRILEDHSPALYVARLATEARTMRIYFDCGTSDDAIDRNRVFHARLDSLGIAHTFHEYPGSHTWDYWNAHLGESLQAVTGALRTGATPG